MHVDPNTMTAWELAYALTEMADAMGHHPRRQTILRAAVRRLTDDAERTGEPGFIPGHQATPDRETIAARAGRQSDPPFRPMTGEETAAHIHRDTAWITPGGVDS